MSDTGWEWVAPLGLENGEFGALGYPRIKSLLQAVLLKCSLKGFFMAKKGFALARCPWEDQCFPLY